VYNKILALNMFFFRFFFFLVVVVQVFWMNSIIAASTRYKLLSFTSKQHISEIAIYKSSCRTGDRCYIRQRLTAVACSKTWCKMPVSFRSMCTPYAFEFACILRHTLNTRLLLLQVSRNKLEIGLLTYFAVS